MVHVCVSFTCSLVYERRLMSPFVFRMFILPHSLIFLRGLWEWIIISYGHVHKGPDIHNCNFIDCPLESIIVLIIGLHGWRGRGGQGRWWYYCQRQCSRKSNANLCVINFLVIFTHFFFHMHFFTATFPLAWQIYLINFGATVCWLVFLALPTNKCTGIVLAPIFTNNTSFAHCSARQLHAQHWQILFRSKEPIFGNNQIRKGTKIASAECTEPRAISN